MEAIETRIAQTLDLKGKVDLARASSAFTVGDAERLVVELYGYKPSDEVLAGLLTTMQKFTTRRSRLFAAVNARLDMIESVLNQARAGAAQQSTRPAVVRPSPRAPQQTAERPLPVGAYQERLSGVARPINEAIDEGRAFVRKEGVRTGHEWAYVHDDAGRSIARLSSGKVNFVEVNRRVLPELYSAEHRITLHHNHPSSSSFSVDDVSVFQDMLGLDTLFAHGHDGTVYRMRAAIRVGIAGRAKTADRLATRAMQAAVNSGTMNVLDANNLVAHARNEALHRRGIIEYRVEPSTRLDLALKRNALTLEVVIGQIVNGLN